jgi:hypothetical protein
LSARNFVVQKCQWFFRLIDRQNLLVLT